MIFAWLRDMTGLEKVALSSARNAESAAGVRPTCTTEVWFRENVRGASEGDLSGVSTIAETHF